jgi:hypothetical protein
MQRIFTTLDQIAVSERQFLMQKCTLLVEHPPIHSPYLVLCNCSVLLTTTFLLKRMHFVLREVQSVHYVTSKVCYKNASKCGRKE